MGTIDKRVDAYIEKSADFAKPILTKLRELVHKGCPEVVETMKWSMPHFDYKGSILCSMAAFKNHAVFGFWKGSLLEDSHQLFDEKMDAMGHFGQLHSVADLPEDKILLAYIKQAAKLNEDGIKRPLIPKHPTTAQAELIVPDDLQEALDKNDDALTTFTNFSPSNKREYVSWLNEAKTDATRQKRLETAMEWMAEGKVRLWKYAKK